ncbi:MAG: alpha/beta hydrolase [Acidimicrobiaceae bacterium]|jgi:pimeloyl-ACP methyl ester carboxylesterase|nr:alpha/beta hydrolase [Acidimicrobiaceae bacterium]|tara:strand:- start:142804 stop:143679 length:876 start_codon:yes stop_codon:yes gene_type:complete
MSIQDKFAEVNGIQICYRTTGNQDGTPLLLVMGLGAQLISWPEKFIEQLQQNGFWVVWFDNRDCGLSSKTQGKSPDGSDMLVRSSMGEEITSAYSLSDMALDAIGLLDHLDIPTAHILGASMGGMIAQTLAIEHPKRVRSLTSIMSATGNPDDFTPTEEALSALLSEPLNEKEQIIAANVAASKVLAGPLWSEPYAREMAEKNYERSFYPEGIGFQMGAIGMSGDRSAKLAKLSIPTLVIHGEVDPLLPLHCGVSTASAIPGSKLVTFKEMGHDLPEKHWSEIIGELSRLG